MIDTALVFTVSFLLGYIAGEALKLQGDWGGHKSKVAETSDEDPRRLERTGHIPHDMRADEDPREER